MANIAYVRVSTLEQNEQRQIQALKKHNIEKWFTEKVSAKDTKQNVLSSVQCLIMLVKVMLFTYTILADFQ